MEETNLGVDIYSYTLRQRDHEERAALISTNKKA
jgi:hypothetical protein